METKVNSAADQHVARQLVQSGLLTAQQIHAAARQRTPDKDLAQIIVEMGLLSPAQIAQITELQPPVSRATSAPPLVSAPQPNGNNGHANLTPKLNGNGNHTPPLKSSPKLETDTRVSPGLASEAGATRERNPEPQSPATNVGLGHDVMPLFDSSGVTFEGDGQTERGDEEGAAVRTCNELLQTAISLRASDLHLEPTDRGLLPRFRIDGQLRPGRLIPTEIQLSVISRLKLIARMDITETRLSQDGRFRATIGGRLFDFRVSSLPGVQGEKAVVRVLDPAALVTDLGRLGFSPEVRASFEQMLKRAHGMILVTGPTGSGKTTTLYAALATTRDETKNVVTVEDPVEYNMKGIMQCDVNAEIGNTFAARLRSILRQDPDVILVGEIRDTETAEMAVRAALTGHQVLSTLHTNSAAAAVTRLQDMGLESFLIASSLTGVLAQRLVRMICRHCRTPLALDSPEYEIALEQWKLTPGTPLYYGAGCNECKGVGLRGRLAILEWLVIDKTVRHAIMGREDADTLHRIAVENGMKTLFQDGMDKLKQGLTTSGELARIFLAAEDTVSA